jgi:hypothetical protein
MRTLHPQQDPDSDGVPLGSAEAKTSCWTRRQAQLEDEEEVAVKQEDTDEVMVKQEGADDPLQIPSTSSQSCQLDIQGSIFCA